MNEVLREDFMTEKTRIINMNRLGWALNELNDPPVESPSISPAVTEPAVEKAAEPVAEPKIELTPEPPVTSEAAVAEPKASLASNVVALARRMKLRPRHKRYAVLAASVVLAATLGAVFGSLVGPERLERRRST